MLIVYILLIALGALPLWITIRYVLLEEKIRRHGISTSGVITHIHVKSVYRGPTTDRVHVRYDNIIPGHYNETSFVAKHNKYSKGQEVPVKYLPEKPDKIIVAEKREYWVMLFFSVAILLFVIFASYKINEMVNA